MLKFLFQCICLFLLIYAGAASGAPVEKGKVGKALPISAELSSPKKVLPISAELRPKAPATPLKTAKIPTQAELDAGRELFKKANCAICHPRGENSLHGDKPIKGQAFLRKYPEDQNIIDFVRHGAPEHGMPKFPKEILADNDLKSIVVYIRSLTH